MPSSLCGCFWACCGTATPCIKCIARCIQNVETTNNLPISTNPPTIPEMDRN